MSEIDVTTVRDEALRKIGRNLVSFQKMERALKILVSRSKMSGYVSEIEKAQKKRTKAIEKRTMGSLVTDFMDSVHGEDSPSEDEPADLTEAWVSVSFRIGSDKEETKARKKAMTLVVAERNALVHKMLDSFDPDSVESCQQLIQQLDEQRARVSPHYKYVMQGLAAMQTAQKGIYEQLKSMELSSGEESERKQTPETASETGTPE